MPKKYHVKSNEDLNNLNASINSGNNESPTISSEPQETMAYDESINVMPDGMLEAVSPTDMAILAVAKASPEAKDQDTEK